ncbi:thioredoxin peroxidase [Candidatus Pacearchaeota archaeon]|nr:thioredoxin peroxidase [Candidatus Pacearchaeota archaeon]|tara:strand:+ start:3383 stop:3892 length:510 start_codon:yes stop_codon:yes gene_type:complete
MKVGDKIEDFEFEAYHDGDFKQGRLSDYSGRWVVLFFYPLDFTFVCPTEIKKFSDKMMDFENENATIVAASTDSVHSHKAWFARDLPDVRFPVIGDTNHNVAKRFNVLQENGTALRGTFIIDPDSVLRYQVVSDDNVGRSIEETLRVLKALKTGGLCPVEWKTGDKTLD